MVYFVFSTGTGSPQTVDFTNINKDTYLEVLNEKDNEGHYKIKHVTADMPTTRITATTTIDNTASKDNAWYTLSGMKMMQQPNQPGIYIHQGKKLVIKLIINHTISNQSKKDVLKSPLFLFCDYFIFVSGQHPTSTSLSM